MMTSLYRSPATMPPSFTILGKGLVEKSLVALKNIKFCITNNENSSKKISKGNRNQRFTSTDSIEIK
jgi:hypothetical protein